MARGVCSLIEEHVSSWVAFGFTFSLIIAEKSAIVARFDCFRLSISVFFESLCYPHSGHTDILSAN